MHKYPDFSESSFFKIWSDEGRVVVSEILNNPDLIEINNFSAWRQDYDIDPEVTNHDKNGFAICTAVMREIEHGVMSDMRAPLGDSLPVERGNAKSYTIPIAHFTSRHFHETKTTMMDKKERFEALRDAYGEYDAKLIASYAENVQTFIDDANMTLTYMGEQLQTNAYVFYDKGAGIHAGIHKAPVPVKNFLGACVFKMSGTSEVQTTWADTKCLFIKSMNRLIEQINNVLGKELVWQLDMPKAIWDSYIKTNEEVLQVMAMKANPLILSAEQMNFATAGMTFEDEDILAMLNSRIKNCTVKLHNSAQYDAFEGIVRGWKTGVATLRPLGRAGLIRHTDIIDAEWFDTKYSNPAIKDFYVPALMGLGFINNTIWPNGRDMEWRYRYIYSSTPSLDEFLYHFILNTGSASANGNWYTK